MHKLLEPINSMEGTQKNASPRAHSSIGGSLDYVVALLYQSGS